MEGRVAWKNDLAHSLLIWSIGAHTNHQLEDNLDVTLVYKERDHATRIVSVFFGQQGLRRVWWFLVAVLQPSLESWGSKISVFFIWSYYYTFIWWLYWSGIDLNRIFINSIDQWSVSNALNTRGRADNRRLMCNLCKKDWARLKANFDPLFTYHFNLKLHEFSRWIIHTDLKNTE